MMRIKYLLFTCIVLVISITIFTEVWLQDYRLVSQWNFPYDPPGFIDTYQLTWASEAYALGYDPMVKHPYHPKGYKYRFPYPRLWHLLFHLGLRERHAKIIGTILMAIFFLGLGIFWFSNRFDNTTYLLLTIFFLSPVVVLGIERGNNELIVFFFVVVALTTFRYSKVASILFLEFASMLKLFPIFGSVYLIKEDRRLLKLFFLVIIIFVIYVLVTFSDITKTYNITPRHTGTSFGVNVWWMGLRHPRFFNFHILDGYKLIFRIISYVAATGIILKIFLDTMRRGVEKVYRDGDYIDAFRVGSGIYIGCFLLINNNDYRLIFLAFTLPQIVEWIKKVKYKIPTAPSITLFAMGLSLWSFFIMRFLGKKATFLMEEFANWVVFTGLVYLFFASLPGWFKEYLYRPFSSWRLNTR